MLPNCGFGIVVYTVIFCRLLIMTRGYKDIIYMQKMVVSQMGQLMLMCRLVVFTSFYLSPKSQAVTFFILGLKGAQ